ncbi:hypothetical protein JL09_g6637 [Pichia kudriavzevii]|uniref:Uncharacterized protein n=1 Tax=Pichia kudriavzevii TaxID=4909 RepID=A0A099NLE3_PICKU|nr:hypothetical protein JL09_g6671 [Pichia kudriavzevii]KGK32767.1 hypothetical protein JL09_g6637 [Pichia kudriavzevii]
MGATPAKNLASPALSPQT